MTQALLLRDVALKKSGLSLTLSVPEGQAVGIVGPAASGKSFLLRVMAGLETPVRGEVQRKGRVLLAGGLPRRARPQSLARSGKNSPSQATDALMATGLWDVRHHSISDLTPGQLAACELLPVLTGEAAILAIDGQLDDLDPWALRTTLDHLRNLMKTGATVLAATNRPDIVAQLDVVVALAKSEIRFAGLISDLLREGPQHHLEVKAENQSGVRALVEPFEVSVREREDGVVLQASEGQALAARLLLEGYGNVKFVVVRQPTVEEALFELLK